MVYVLFIQSKPIKNMQNQSILDKEWFTKNIEAGAIEYGKSRFVTDAYRLQTVCKEAFIAGAEAMVKAFEEANKEPTRKPGGGYITTEWLTKQGFKSEERSNYDLYIYGNLYITTHDNGITFALYDRSEFASIPNLRRGDKYTVNQIMHAIWEENNKTLTAMSEPTPQTFKELVQDMREIAETVKTAPTTSEAIENFNGALERFAGQAMQALIQCTVKHRPDYIAEKSVEFAKSLIAELNKQK